jgi:hypothetical protein
VHMGPRVIFPRHFPQPLALDVFRTSTPAQHTVKSCCSLARRGWPLMAKVDAESCASLALGANGAGDIQRGNHGGTSYPNRRHELQEGSDTGQPGATGSGPHRRARIWGCAATRKSRGVSAGRWLLLPGVRRSGGLGNRPTCVASAEKEERGGGAGRGASWDEAAEVLLPMVIAMSTSSGERRDSGAEIGDERQQSPARIGSVLSGAYCVPGPTEHTILGCAMKFAVYRTCDD